ncbi:MAG: lytic murein transglycosylase B [Gammaproteobacteria bacterium]|nr:lytic murein transglycosylase B [Gammaproteobacteria bacterium]
MKPQLLFAIIAATILTAPAALGLDVDRPEVQAYVNDLVKEHGLDADYLLAMLEGAETQQSILDAMARPAEKTRPWKDYRGIFLTPERIEAGSAFWKEQDARLTQVATRTGVPPEMLTGILGVETWFGTRAGRYRLLDSLATLAFDYPPRSGFFRGELTQLFLLARDEGLDVSQAVGSYAGAMGAPQFIPSSYRNFAVDGDGDGKRDLFNSWDDVLASIANYFVMHKWRPGEPVVTRATLARPTDRQPGDNGLAPDSTVAGLRKLGVRFTTDLGADAPAGLVVLQGEEGPEYWVAFHNFYVVTRYNRSTMYALAVYQLGQAIGEARRSVPGGSLHVADGS